MMRRTGNPESPRWALIASVTLAALGFLGIVAGYLAGVGGGLAGGLPLLFSGLLVQAAARAEAGLESGTASERRVLRLLTAAAALLLAAAFGAGVAQIGVSGPLASLPAFVFSILGMFGVLAVQTWGGWVMASRKMPRGTV